MKSRLIILFLAFCLTQTVHRPSYAQQTSGAGELIVRVKSSDGPVEGAVVLLTGNSSEEKLNITNAEGFCDFRDLRPGTYSLKLIQRSYFPTAESKTQMDLVEMSQGQSKALTLNLVKGAVLKGKVLSVDGSPVIGIPVSALMLAGHKISLPSTAESNGTALSDDRGEFRLYGLRPGTYTIAVNAQRNLSPLKSFTTLFYPGERESSKASAFELVAGQEVSIPDMVLDLTVTNQNSLTGLVRGANSEALTGVSLALLSKASSHLADITVSDYQGRFVFEGVPAGDYLLKASFNSQGYFNVQREVSVKESAANNVTLELKSYPLISGLAYIRSKAGVMPLSGFKLLLEPTKITNQTIEFVTDKEGRFSQRADQTGSFRWAFPELPAEYFVSRILVAGKDMGNGPVEVEPASDLPEIAIELSTGAAQIRGTAPTGACKLNTVYAVALHSKRDEVRSTHKAQCSADSFSVQSLAPGRYYVIGLSNHKPVADRDGDSMDQAVRTLKARGIKTITLEREENHNNARVVIVDVRTEPTRN